MKNHLINSIVAKGTERKKIKGEEEAGKMQNPTSLINQLFSFTMVIFRLQIHSLLKNNCRINFM